METETWKPVPRLAFIEASNLGRVRVLPRVSKVYGRVRDGTTQGAFIQKRPGRLLSPCITRGGYFEVALMTDGKRVKYRVHRLVAQTFVAGYFPDASIDHVDGDKLNNRADNLEWVTLAENTRRQWASGLVDLRGEGQPGAKLTKEQAAAIKCLGDAGFPDKLVAGWFGVGAGTVAAIKCGSRWKKTLAA